MRKKRRIALLALLMAGLLIGNGRRRPRLISSITTLDTAYLTILVDPEDAEDVENLKEKLLEMCREDQFSGIKLHTEGKQEPQTYYFRIYTSEKKLKEGTPQVTIKAP